MAKREGVKSMDDIVHIKTPDGLNTGVGTKITNTAGVEILGVSRAVINIACYEAVKARLDVYCDFEGDAHATFCAKHPVSGEYKAVTRMVFEDGSEWAANA
jgi:hypothetical protein